ncbi:glycerophosphodiester phosphodiesterase [Agromyces sp. LHK192]|uniref:glycerophosphodiester phosphodiesterase n=1 Tax=Agromyces sp. LHK192 TaxID=2498704 RepID=UPI000FDB7FC1|nr:glycerophosphodiester phosphodiesterase [Agromyces sp. LHK192]
MASTYLTPARPRVLAHRGLALDAPENTIAAFAAAIAVGASYLETDVRRSNDGVPVLAHDPTLERVAGRKTEVSALTLAELRAIDLGGGSGFPTLEEALVAFPEVRFNIDVKDDGAVDAVIEVVRRTGAGHRVLLTSFDDRRRRRLGAAVPEAVTSGGRTAVIRAWLASIIGSTQMLRRALAGASALQVPERVGPIPLVTDRFLAGVHAAGAEVHVWTVNEPDEMRRLLAKGVDGLVTDRCDLAVEVVRERT